MNNFAESLKTQMENIVIDKYPYIRRDKTVRARLLDTFYDDTCETDMVLVETMEPRARFKEPCKRILTKEYWENNYWEGKE